MVMTTSAVRAWLPGRRRRPTAEDSPRGGGWTACGRHRERLRRHRRGHPAARARLRRWTCSKCGISRGAAPPFTGRMGSPSTPGRPSSRRRSSSTSCSPWGAGARRITCASSLASPFYRIVFHDGRSFDYTGDEAEIIAKSAIQPCRRRGATAGSSTGPARSLTARSPTWPTSRFPASGTWSKSRRPDQAAVAPIGLQTRVGIHPGPGAAAGLQLSIRC